MSDYVLKEGQKDVVVDDVSCDNFIYEGGEITVSPSASFVINGSYIFRPTTSGDPPALIYGCFLNRLRLECGRNGFLKGFKIYDTYPETTPLFFPCIVMDQGEQGTVRTSFFGGEYLEHSIIACDLAFKKGKFLDIDARDEEGNQVIHSEEAMAEYFLWKTREVLKAIEYESDVILVGDVVFRDSIQSPRTPSQTLYGFKMDIYVEWGVR